MHTLTLKYEDCLGKLFDCESYVGHSQSAPFSEVVFTFRSSQQANDFCIRWSINPSRVCSPEQVYIAPILADYEAGYSSGLSGDHTPYDTNSMAWNKGWLDGETVRAAIKALASIMAPREPVPENIPTKQASFNWE